MRYYLLTCGTFRYQKQATSLMTFTVFYTATTYNFAAYERLRTNKGALTVGSDKQDMDFIAQISQIDKLMLELRNGMYRPGPVCRTYMPTPFNKDKLVQEILRLILDAIFEPSFVECSYDFYSHHSFHTAGRQVEFSMSGVVWVIEGNIAKCFDELIHKKIMKFLSERISDKRFLKLIEYFLTAGYLDPIIPKSATEKQNLSKRLQKANTSSLSKRNYQLVKQKMGMPQDNIFSPILCNIYFRSKSANMISPSAKFNFRFATLSFRPKAEIIIFAKQK
eukprot:TRINITY_DN5127_c0_g1_i10.p1 TRINITY_DN5127_c0_g1~~TRINITY_DN5127_c0_g1_i10.p1  ORF type:complete len:278 (-),score=-1.79 TRINITY_DN5127_c0_g1_i10:298-1131(-)